MKKLCEQCGIEFKYTREAARFCSGKCRVKWNRNNPKKEVSKVQMGVLYNQILDLVSEMKNKMTDQLGIPSQRFISETTTPKENPINYFGIPEQKKKIKLKRSFENYQQLRKDCPDEDEWLKLKEEILSAEHLSSKQIVLLTN
jgi:hypothetical protein